MFFLGFVVGACSQALWLTYVYGRGWIDPKHKSRRYR